MLQMPGKNLLLVCKMIMRHAGRMFVLSKICCMYLSWVWSCYKNNSQDGFGNSRNLILNFHLKVQLDSQLPFVQGGAEGCRSCSRSWRSQVASGRSLTVYLELRTGKQYPCGSCTTHDMKLAAMEYFESSNDARPFTSTEGPLESISETIEIAILRLGQV